MLLSFLKKGMIDYYIAKSMDYFPKYNPVMDECYIEVRNLNKKYIKFSPTTNWHVFGKLVDQFSPNFNYNRKSKYYSCQVTIDGNTNRYLSACGETIPVAFCKTVLLCRFGTNVDEIPTADIVNSDLKKIENNEKI